MPWVEVNKVDLRKELIYRYLRKENVTDLCREYQISRKTAYKFIHRFEQDGLDGLKDESRRPHLLANKTDELVEQLISATKWQYPSWGAKKLKPYLEKLYPLLHFPSNRIGWYQCHKVLRKKEHLFSLFCSNLLHPSW